MTADLKFGPLPPKASGKHDHKDKWAPWRKQLMERPGEWAQVPVPYKQAHVVIKRVPGFEAVCRTVDGEKAVFARYVGDEDGVA